MANPGLVQVTTRHRIRRKRSGRSVNPPVRRNAVVAARDGCVAAMRADPNRKRMPAGRTGPVTGLWHQQTQPSGMTAGPAIPAICGQRKVTAGIFDSAGLAVRIRTEGWQDDVAARLHTGLPPYMHVSAATCRPALWPDLQVPREYVPISEPVRHRSVW